MEKRCKEAEDIFKEDKFDQVYKVVETVLSEPKKQLH